MDIIYVDDETPLLDIAKLFLEKEGDINVDTVESAGLALEALKSRKYDAIVADYMMPEMDGIAFLKSLRSSGYETPFILFTGRGREEVAIEALNNGADFYLNKGGDPRSQFAELVNMIKQAVSRKHAEETLQKSEERHRTTLDNMMEGCQIVGPDWRYLYLNDASAAHGHKRKEELLGHTMMEIYPGIENTQMFAALRECLERQVRCQLENEFTYPDGSGSWFELSFEPVPEGVFILSMDITERKRAEELVRESEEHFRSLIENASDIIAVVDARGDMKFLSPSIEGVIGYKPEELVGRNVSEFLHPDDLEHSMTGLIRVADGETTRRMVELRLRRKDGSWCPIEAVGSISRGKNGNAGDVVVNARDITERKNASMRLEHLNKVLRAIHNVNMLIVKERDRDRLLQGVADNLVNTRGFYGAWIMLVDDSGRPFKTYGAGLGKRTAILDSMPVSGTVPSCVPRALHGEEIVISHSHDPVCQNCMLSEPNTRRAVITARLSHRGRLFGLMHVSLPAVVADEEDMLLMEELAGDVAYALYHINAEEVAADQMRPGVLDDSGCPPLESMRLQ